jgi:hypothetical protein
MMMLAAAKTNATRACFPIDLSSIFVVVSSVPPLVRGRRNQPASAIGHVHRCPLEPHFLCA